MMGLGMGFGLFGILLTLLFFGGLIFGAVWLAKAIFQSSTDASSPMRYDAAQGAGSTREILDRRYARGEITREQYEMMKNDLGV